MVNAKPIDVDRVNELLDYDSVTGIFRWKFKHGRAGRGTIAGRLSKRYGYRQIQIDGRHYMAQQKDDKLGKLSYA